MTIRWNGISAGLAFALGVALAQTGCAPATSGKLDVTGTAPPNVDLDIKVDKCQQDKGGVDLGNDNYVYVRAYQDNVLGDSVDLIDGQNGGQNNLITFDQTSGCQTLTVDIHETGNVYNGEAEVAGSLQLSCDMPGGGTAVANVQYRGCL